MAIHSRTNLPLRSESPLTLGGWNSPLPAATILGTVPMALAGSGQHHRAATGGAARSPRGDQGACVEHYVSDETVP